MKKEAPAVTITKEEIQETMEEEQGHDPEEAKVSVGMINLTQDADAPDPQEFPAAEPQSTESDSGCEGFCSVCGQHFMPAHPTLLAHCFWDRKYYSAFIKPNTLRCNMTS